MQFFGAAMAAPDGANSSQNADAGTPLASFGTVGMDLVQIPYLSDERSQEVKDILQEQQVKKNPLKSRLQTMQCNDDEKAKNETPLTTIAKSLMPFLTWFPRLD